MNKKIYTRKATVKDLNILLEMGYELFLVEKEFEPLMTFSKEEAENRYAYQLQHSIALFLLLYVNENVAGYAYAHLEKPESLSTTKLECEFEVLYLKPEFRGQGLSATLISEVISWAKEQKVFRIKTDIFTRNKASIQVFEKQGFQAHNIGFVLDMDKE
jgi:GNAT superfamily N-acetyltransferase